MHSVLIIVRNKNFTEAVEQDQIIGLKRKLKVYNDKDRKSAII